MKSVLLWAACVASFAATDALTASNAVGPASAGSGSSGISGYVVSDVHYEVAGDAVASVSFALSATPGSVARVRLRPDGAWHTCALTGPQATCATAGEPVATATELAVVVA